MRQVAESGDLTRKLTLAEQDDWWDEDAQVLARTFNSLTDAITRFQREAAQRERLSALGRLSTVIAHEVRNPLMIIKGALRTVVRPGVERRRPSRCCRRHRRGDCAAEPAGARSPRLRATDPLRVLRPTDLNRVCEDAAEAVSVNGHPPPALQLAPLPPVVTDRERIRIVLVNLLTNAQQAVDAAGATRLGARDRGHDRAAGGRARGHLGARPRPRHRSR